MKKTEQIPFSVQESPDPYDKIILKYGKEPEYLECEDEEIFMEYPDYEYLFEDIACFDLYDEAGDSQYELFYTTEKFEEMKAEKIVLEEYDPWKDPHSEECYPQEHGFYDNNESGPFFEGRDSFEFSFLPPSLPPELEESNYSESFIPEPPELEENEYIMDSMFFDEYLYVLDCPDYSFNDYMWDGWPEYGEEDEKKFWMTSCGVSIKEIYEDEVEAEDNYIKRMIEEHCSRDGCSKKIIKSPKESQGTSYMSNINHGVVGQITSLLKDPNVEVRMSAADSLGMIAHPGSVKPLMEALKDPEREVRRSARKALNKVYKSNPDIKPDERLSNEKGSKAFKKYDERFWMSKEGKRIMDLYEDEVEREEERIEQMIEDHCMENNYSADTQETEIDNDFDDLRDDLFYESSYDEPSFHEKVRRFNKRLIDENDEYMDDIIAGLYGKR